MGDPPGPLSSVKASYSLTRAGLRYTRSILTNVGRENLNLVILCKIGIIFKILHLLSSYIASTGTVTTNRALPNPYITSLLPQGKKSEDYNVVIRVDIFDQRGASHVEMLTVKVS